MPKFAVAILLSHCAGGISTASGDMNIDDFNLFLPHLRRVPFQGTRYRRQCFGHLRQSRIYGYFCGLNTQVLCKIESRLKARGIINSA